MITDVSRYLFSTNIIIYYYSVRVYSESARICLIPKFVILEYFQLDEI